MDGKILKLGTPTCPSSPIPLNSVGSLTAQVLQGTAPFTYTWLITRPDSGVDTLANGPGPYNYTFNLAGIYTITLTILDSCPQGQLTDSASCTVTVQQATTGSINLTSSPSGADIYLDGTLQAVKTPATITSVSAGSHSYLLRLAGYNDATGTVTVTAGLTATVSVTLTLIVTTGSISFTSSPSGADIYLDNVLQSVKTPATITSVSAGSHTYIIRLTGYSDAVGTVTVTAGQTAVSVTLTSTVTALTTNGKNYIAQNFGISNGYSSSGLSWTAVANDDTTVNESGGTASIVARLVTTSVYKRIDLTAPRIGSYTYVNLKQANDNTDVVLTDAQWVAANDGSPAGEAQYYYICVTPSCGIIVS
jgi:hypothetical protein